MALPKFSELLFRINNPGVAPEKVSDRGIFESATYKYDDLKAPGDAALTTGYEADDIHYPSVKAHMKNKGVPEDHANAIVAHLKKGSGYTDSDKKGFDVKSTHGNFVVHSSSNSEGKTKFHVSNAMKNEETEQMDEAKDPIKDQVKKAMKEKYGPGKVTFHRASGGHFVHHEDNDGDMSYSHEYHPVTGKVNKAPHSTASYYEEFEQVNEISAGLAMSALAKRQKQNQGPMSDTDYRKVKRGGNPVDTEHDTFRRAMKKPGAAAARFTAVYGPSKEKM